MDKFSFYSPEKIGVKKSQTIQNKTQSSKTAPLVKGRDFQSILKDELNKNQELKFSAHAQSRLISRNIALSRNDINKLQQAVQKAEEKGSKESLILMQDLAFIVNVKNKTVITVANQETAKENVFTNIDSTIII